MKTSIDQFCGRACAAVICLGHGHAMLRQCTVGKSTCYAGTWTTSSTGFGELWATRTRIWMVQSSVRGGVGVHPVVECSEIPQHHDQHLCYPCEYDCLHWTILVCNNLRPTPRSSRKGLTVRPMRGNASTVCHFLDGRYLRSCNCEAGVSVSSTCSLC